MLLINPPLCKPSEPPAALAYLAGSLRAHGHPCTVCDMSIESLHGLLRTAPPATDTWSRRAFRDLQENIAALRAPALYHARSRYRRAVADINRVVEIAGRRHGLQLSLANYQDQAHSPLQSADLYRAATDYRQNIFFTSFQERLDALLEENASPYIGFSLNYLSQALCTFAMLGYLRDNFPDRQIILGGGLITTWLSDPHRTANPFPGLVDHCIGGRGEAPLLYLLDSREQSEPTLPDFTGLVDNPYLAPGLILPYAASSGCFWRRCTFCPEKSEQNPYRQIPPANVVSELQRLVSATRPVLIHLLDNAISPATLQALAAKPPGKPWYGFARIDRTLADPAFCRQLRASGCVMLKLGLESGDQQLLDRLDKGIDLDLAARVLANLAGAGIRSYVYLLFGTPGESRAEAERTQAFVKAHAENISFLNLAIFNLPINSPESTALAVEDFYEGDLAIYRNFVHPQGWNRREVRRFLDESFKREPEIATILARDPPFFTSNHAAFFDHSPVS